MKLEVARPGANLERMNANIYGNVGTLGKPQEDSHPVGSYSELDTAHRQHELPSAVYRRHELPV
jgi:hypothetical protein